MRYECPENTKESSVTYVRNRIENNYFIVYYKNVAQIKLTPKEVGRVFGVAKFTPTVNKIREWCYEMVEKYESQSSLEDDTDTTVGIVDKEGGFGPECHEEPNDNTKMVI